ncbi:MAG: glutaredoxin domain-containing protein [Mycobacteriales bacterium]
MITAPDCHFCAQAKATLSRIALEVPFDVEYVDGATERGQELAARAGMAFPPAVLVDGEPFSYGRLSERALRRALAARGARAGS